MRHHLSKATRLALAGSLLGAAACGGTDSAQVGPGPTSPGPNGAAPSGTVALPQGFGVKSSTTALTDSASGASSTTYTFAITEGAALAAEIEELLQIMLAPLEALQIPAGSSAPTHSATVTFPTKGGGGNQGANVEAKIDLSDFDLDGDGAKEECSGHTAALPICLRVWLDGERFLAARFDALPNANGPGAGHLVLRKVAALPGGEQGMGVSVVFDHRDPAATSTDLAWGMPPNEPTSTGEPFVAIRHALLQREGTAPAARMTLNLSDRMLLDSQTTGGGANTLRYLGRYRADEALWSGSIDVEGVFGSMLGIEGFATACVELSTGNAVSDQPCEQAGIGLANASYVDFADAKAASLPTDFPQSPGF